MDLRPYLQFNRKISLPLSRWIARTPATPNFITVCGLFCAATAMFSMLKGDRAALLTGAFWMHLALILDNCDGEVARLKGMATPFGRWLDSICDVVVDLLLWSGLYFAAVHSGFFLSLWWLWLAATGSFLNFILVIWERKSGCSSSIHDESTVREQRRKSSFFSVLDSVTHNGDAAFLIWSMALVGNPVWFLVSAAVYMNVIGLTRLAANAKKLSIKPSIVWRWMWKALALGLGIWILFQVLYGVSWKELGVLIGRAGWPLFWTFLIFPICTVFHALAFRRLYPESTRRRIPFSELYWIKITGEAFNKVTPFLDIGGDPAKAMLLKKHGYASMDESIAALGVFRVSYVAGEILMVLAGLAAMTWLRPSWQVTAWTAAAVLFSAVYIYLIVKSLKKIAGQEVHQRIIELLRFSNRDLWAAMFWNGAGWVCLFLEAFLVLRFLGIPIGVLPAFIVQSLLQAVQTVSFFIPANLGAQEAGLAFLLNYFYFSPAAGVALSLIKRARQLIWAVLAIPLYFYFKHK